MSWNTRTFALVINSFSETFYVIPIIFNHSSLQLYGRLRARRPTSRADRIHQRRLTGAAAGQERGGAQRRPKNKTGAGYSARNDICSRRRNIPQGFDKQGTLP